MYPLTTQRPAFWLLGYTSIQKDGVFKMKAWFQRFMSGRYGSDTFGNFLCVTALVCLVIGLFMGIFLLYRASAAALCVLPHAQPQRTQALCRKHCLYAENRWCARQVRPAAAAVCPAQNLPLFFLPALPPAGTRAQGPRQNFHHLPQMRHPVH